MAENENVLRELTAGQLGIWNAQRLEPESRAFNVSEYVELRGDLDVDLFRQALRQALDQAGSYHLRFTDSGGMPRQFAGPAPEYPIRLVDVSDAADPEAAAAALMRADRARRIDLTGTELYVHIIFVLDARRHFWYQRTHHVLVDGYSLSVFAAAVAANYDALTRRCPAAPALEPVTVLLDAELGYRGSAEFADDRRFWLDSLAGLPEAERHPGRRWLPDTPTQHTRPLTPDDAAGLRAAAGRYGTSLAQLAIAAAALYHHRITGARISSSVCRRSGAATAANWPRSG